MISQTQILRLADAGEHRQLIQRILANGRCRSRTAVAMLGEPDAAAAAAMGLALQRICEITYGAANLPWTLVGRLLQQQRPDGWFGPVETTVGPAMLAGTAVAVRGLVSFLLQCNGLYPAEAERIDAAVHRALDAMRAPEANGCAHKHLDGARTDHSMALGCRPVAAATSPWEAPAWAIVLWQLGDLEEFRTRFPVDEMVCWLSAMGHRPSSNLADSRQPMADFDDLCRYALAMAA